MNEIPLRELRNHTSEVLRRVEGGEQLTVTVNGRGVAQLVPLPRRKPYLTLDEITAHRADPGLQKDLGDLLGDETTDDMEDPWEREARRWRQK